VSAAVELVLIPRDHIVAVWDLAEPHLKRALSYADQEFTIEDVRKLLEEGRFQLWIGWDVERKQPVGAGVTEIFDYPRRRVCFLVLWASEAPRSTWLSCLATVEHWASAKGCVAMRLLGRKGWGRVLDGYRPQYTVFVRSFDDA
jgi:hypothetical protein